VQLTCETAAIIPLLRSRFRVGGNGVQNPTELSRKFFGGDMSQKPRQTPILYVDATGEKVPNNDVTGGVFRPSCVACRKVGHGVGNGGNAALQPNLKQGQA